MTSTQKTYLVGGIILFFAVVISFFIGLRAERFIQQRSMFFAQYNMRPYRGMRGMMYGKNMFPFGSGFGRGVISGQITAISANQITVKLSNGTTQTILLPNTTTFTQIDSVAQNSLQQGQNVTVVGQNVNGSFSAARVNIYRQQLTPTPTP